MKTKIQKTFATLALAMGLLLPVAAQQVSDKNPPATPPAPATQPFGQVQQYEPVKPKPVYLIKTPLKCEQGFDKFPYVAVNNNTGGTLKRGLIIYYTSDTHPETRTHKLLADWVAGSWLNASTHNFQSCKAWYLK